MRPSSKMSVLKLLVVLAITIGSAIAGEEFKRVCYFTNWSQYRNAPAAFQPADIDVSLCTHGIYAYADLWGNKLEALEWNDESSNWVIGMYEQFNDLKKENPEFKTLLSIGGNHFDLKQMSAMLETEENRQEFCDTSITFLRKRNFDGLDLNFQFPGSGESIPEDKKRYASLVTQCAAAFLDEAEENDVARLLLSVGVAAEKKFIDAGYVMANISEAADFINLLSYDLHDSWEGSTAHHAALHSRQGESTSDRRANVEWAAKYWTDNGCPPEKLVIGIPMFARGFELADESDSGMGAKTSGISEYGPYTREAGFLSYYEVCALYSEGAWYNWQEEHAVPFAVLKDQWHGYDDIYSVTGKVRWLVEQGYGGYGAWSMDLDDFTGQFCGMDRYPLHRAAMLAITTNETLTTDMPWTTPEPTDPTDPPSTMDPSVDLGELCLERGEGIYTHPDDDSKYVVCLNDGRYIVQECPPGTIFDEEKGYCDFP